MSTGTWIRRQRDRPIAEHERHATLASVAVLLSATALLLAFTAQDRQAHSATRRQPTSSLHTPATPMPSAAGTPAPLTPAMEKAARGFLAGYLSYLYGHAPASDVHGADASLTGSLHADRLRVPPGLQGRAARVLGLRPAPAPAGFLGVTALVNDGGVVNYPIALLLARQRGRLIVTGLDGA